MQDVPRVPPLDRPATYDDLVKLPDNLVAEIVEGELHATPRPAVRHALAGSGIGRVVTPAFDHSRPGGWWLLYEPELHFGGDVLVPDWAGWRRARLPHMPDAPYLSLAPDWVCEILSPSTAALDRARKLGIYAREGVSHGWLIDPIAHTLEVLQLESGRWSILATHFGDATVRAVPFDEIELPLRELWPEG
jgi:Uma2 family endonuclease